MVRILVGSRSHRWGVPYAGQLGCQEVSGDLRLTPKGEARQVESLYWIRTGRIGAEEPMLDQNRPDRCEEPMPDQVGPEGRAHLECPCVPVSCAARCAFAALRRHRAVATFSSVTELASRV